MHDQWLTTILPPNDTVKFVDDTTIQEIIKTTKMIQGPSFMQQAYDEVQKWTNDNGMNLNPPKTKEMLTSFATTNPPQITPIQINGEFVSQVKSTKLLWVTISDDLTLNEHILYITKNTTTRLYYCDNLYELYVFEGRYDSFLSFGRI